MTVKLIYHSKATMLPDKMHEECGVFAVYGMENAPELVALGLHALQHRGQESAGISAFNGVEIQSIKKHGLVSEITNDENFRNSIHGNLAIGHVRYSTAGGNTNANIQPVVCSCAFGSIAIAHNGNLTNAHMLREELTKDGAIFQSTMDTEVIAHLIVKSTKNEIVEKIKDALSRTEGAYCLVIIIEDKIYAVRDPNGVRPMCVGEIAKTSDRKSGVVVSSESCAFDIVGARFSCSVNAGEIVQIDESGYKVVANLKPAEYKFCIFEYVYFSRPDSTIENRGVYSARKRIGQILAQEHPVEADIVVPVPDSGVPAALGYSEQSGISFELGIVRSHYVGRTFINPTNQLRQAGVKMKHSANKEVIFGKKIVLIDDSVVRGTTSRKIVQLLRDAGAKEIHLRISSPPTISSCFYGIDTPNSSELLGSKMTDKEMCSFVGANSLEFISINGLYTAICQEKRNSHNPQFCDACFTKDYPICTHQDTQA